MRRRWWRRAVCRSSSTIRKFSRSSTFSDAPTTAGAWLRLLAWSLLTEAPDRSGAVQRRYATLDRLPPLLTDGEHDDATNTTAAALALVFGWRFFHPYIRAALHLDNEGAA